MTESFKKEREVLKSFSITGNVTDITPSSVGLINSTFFVSTDRGNEYVLQRINTSVFRQADRVMSNISAVTRHIEKKGLPTLIFVHTLKGDTALFENGEVYRVSKRINGSTYNTVTPELFFEAAKAFGLFQKALSDFDASLLFETIPDFHNTKKRYEALLASAEKDSFGRKKDCLDLLDFAEENSSMAGTIVDMTEKGELPLRVVHNDTKINNVVFDENGKNGTVIDLDTVMSGSLLYDFGDAVRSGAASQTEGSLDFDNTYIRLDLYEAFLKGFIEGVGSSLTENEKKLLPTSVFVISYELACRFLTDYLSGDVYFKTSYDRHNLDRARGQFKLAEDILNRKEEFEKITEKYL